MIQAMGTSSQHSMYLEITKPQVLEDKTLQAGCSYSHITIQSLGLLRNKMARRENHTEVIRGNNPIIYKRNCTFSMLLQVFKIFQKVYCRYNF